MFTVFASIGDFIISSRHQHQVYQTELQSIVSKGKKDFRRLTKRTKYFFYSLLTIAVAHKKLAASNMDEHMIFFCLIALFVTQQTMEQIN